MDQRLGILQSELQEGNLSGERYVQHCIQRQNDACNALLGNIKSECDAQRMRLETSIDSMATEMVGVSEREQNKICAMVKNLQDAMQKINLERRDSVFDAKIAEMWRKMEDTLGIKFQGIHGEFESRFLEMTNTIYERCAKDFSSDGEVPRGGAIEASQISHVCQELQRHGKLFEAIQVAFGKTVSMDNFKLFQTKNAEHLQGVAKKIANMLEIAQGAQKHSEHTRSCIENVNTKLMRLCDEAFKRKDEYWGAKFAQMEAKHKAEMEGLRREFRDGTWHRDALSPSSLRAFSPSGAAVGGGGGAGARYGVSPPPPPIENSVVAPVPPLRGEFMGGGASSPALGGRVRKIMQLEPSNKENVGESRVVASIPPPYPLGVMPSPSEKGGDDEIAFIAPVGVVPPEDMSYLGLQHFPLHQQLTRYMKHPSFSGEHSEWAEFKWDLNDYIKKLSISGSISEDAKMQVLEMCLSQDLRKELHLMQKTSHGAVTFDEFMSVLERRHGNLQVDSLRRKWDSLMLPRNGRITTKEFKKFEVDFRTIWMEVKDANPSEARRKLLSKMPQYMVQWVMEAQDRKNKERPWVLLTGVDDYSAEEMQESMKVALGFAPHKVEIKGAGRYLLQFENLAQLDKALTLNGRAVVGRDIKISVSVVEQMLGVEEIIRLVEGKLATKEKVENLVDRELQQKIDGDRYNRRARSADSASNWRGFGDPRAAHVVTRMGGGESPPQEALSAGPMPMPTLVDGNFLATLMATLEDIKLLARGPGGRAAPGPAAWAPGAPVGKGNKGFGKGINAGLCGFKGKGSWQGPKGKSWGPGKGGKGQKGSGGRGRGLPPNPRPAPPRERVEAEKHENPRQE